MNVPVMLVVHDIWLSIELYVLIVISIDILFVDIACIYFFKDFNMIYYGPVSLFCCNIWRSGLPLGCGPGMVLWVVSGGYFVEIPFKSVEATCDHHAYVIHHTPV